MGRAPERSGLSGVLPTRRQLDWGGGDGALDPGPSPPTIRTRALHLRKNERLSQGYGAAQAVGVFSGVFWGTVDVKRLHGALFH